MDDPSTLFIYIYIVQISKFKFESKFKIQFSMASENYFRGLAAACSRVLDHHLVGVAEGAAPVLVRSKASRVQAREVISQRATARDRSAKTAERREIRIHAMVVPTYIDPFERRLRKFATHGVVTLFNAIKRHQLDIETAEKETADNAATARERKRMKVAETTSKSQFLSLISKAGSENLASDGKTLQGKEAAAAAKRRAALEEGRGKGEKAGAPAASWRVLDEGMMLETQGEKSWGKEMEGVEGGDMEGEEPTRGFGQGFGAALGNGNGEDDAEADLWADDSDDDDE